MIKADPIVSIVCTVYNQAAFLDACLYSVKIQTYPYIQLIVIDNGSTDNSNVLLTNWQRIYPTLELILNTENKGLCTAFNQGLALAAGKYIIDLSADDVLFPNRVAEQVHFFESLSEGVGVIHSNAYLINEKGSILRKVYTAEQERSIPNGIIFKELLERSVVSTPTMLIRKSVLDILGGYDESLSFEDFDFWIRSGKTVEYRYQPQILMCRRMHSTQMSRLMLKRQNVHLESTLRVCEKAYQLCESETELNALKKRLRLVLRKSVWIEQPSVASKAKILLEELGDKHWTYSLYYNLCNLHLPFNRMYSIYHAWKRKFAK